MERTGSDLRSARPCSRRWWGSLLPGSGETRGPYSRHTRVRVLEAPPGNHGGCPVSCSFNPERGLVVVQTELFGPPGSIVLRLALDTGATGTMFNL